MSKSAHIFDIKDALSKRAAMSGAIEVVSVAERADGLIVSVRLADGSEKAVFAKNEADFFEALDWANKRTVEGGSEVRNASSERTAVVYGYTELGQSICDDLMARGITVIVVEASDPIAAMKAALAGYEVRLPDNAPTTSDFVIDCRSHDGRSGASQPSDVATGAPIQREAVSDAGLAVFRDRAKSPDHYPREAAIVALVDRIGLPFQQAVFAYRELALLFEQKLAPQTSDAVKGRVQNNIPFEDALDVVVKAIAQDPTRKPVVRDRLSGLFEQEAIATENTTTEARKTSQKTVSAAANTFELSDTETTRIADLWDIEVAKGLHNPERRRPAQFIQEELAQELAAGMQRKSLPAKLKQAYAGWLKNNPDAEPVWPDTDRTRPYTKIDDLSAEEALRHLREQELSQQARKRAKAKSKSI